VLHSAAHPDSRPAASIRVVLPPDGAYLTRQPAVAAPAAPAAPAAAPVELTPQQKADAASKAAKAAQEKAKKAKEQAKKEIEAADKEAAKAAKNAEEEAKRVKVRCCPSSLSGMLEWRCAGVGVDMLWRGSGP
jgi:hypothetical protein